MLRGAFAAALLLLLVAGPCPAAAQTPALSPEEQAYLAAHGPIRYIADGDFAPFSFRNAQGDLTGINHDFLRLMTVNLGVDFTAVPARNFSDVLDELRDGTADLGANLAASPEREQFLAFSDPYVYVRIAAWARSGERPPPSDLAGLRVVVVNGTVLATRLPEQFPHASVMTAPNDTSALEALEHGAADLYVGGTPSTAYRLRALDLDDIVPIRTLSETSYAFAVGKNNTMLLGILQKGLASIPEEQRTAIFLKWTGTDLGPTRPPQPFALPLAVQAAVAGLALFLVAFVAWGVMLRRRVAQRTADLARQAAELRAREAQFRGLTESATDAIISADGQGRITYVNPAFTALFGYAAGEAVGQPLTLLMPERYRKAHLEGFHRYLRTGEARVMGRPLELEGRTKDGAEVPLELSISQFERDGKTQFIGILRDLTERKRAERERFEGAERAREVQRLRELSDLQARFINTAAHEINTPLTPMRIQVEVMKSREDDPQMRRGIDILERNILRLSRLVTDLLHAGRLQAERIYLERASVDLRDVVAETAKSFEALAAESDIRLEVRAPPEPVRAEVDAHRVGQVLFNLLHNALKFTPRGGRVVLDVRRDGARAVLGVHDTGIGMTPDQISRLFAPFTQVHDPAKPRSAIQAHGTGLGLYISKGLVELHGGRIWAESDGDGQGTSFYVSLPVSSPPEAKTDGAGEPPASGG